MSKLVIGLLCLLPIALVIIGTIVRRIDYHWGGRWLGRPVRSVCIACLGNGWVQETVRTLDFDGTGFATSDSPAHQCATCHGTGTVMR